MFDWLNNPTSQAPAIPVPQISQSNGITSYQSGGPNSFLANYNTSTGARLPTQQATFMKDQYGNFNSENLGLALGGIQMLGNLWNSYQQQKVAKEQLGLAKRTFETNLANNRQTYNTALEDRIRSRHYTEGKSSAETDAYLSENRL